MKKYIEVLPAAAVGLLLIVCIGAQLLGFGGIGPHLQASVGLISLLLGMLILGLCITGPVIWIVMYVAKRGRNKH